jgi:catechol 2,3-dioxygenase
MQLDIYKRVIGLRPLDAEGRVTALGAGDSVLVELDPDADAPARPARTTGLFHLALLVPTRADLARALRRVWDTS